MKPCCKGSVKRMSNNYLKWVIRQFYFKKFISCVLLLMMFVPVTFPIAEKIGELQKPASVMTGKNTVKDVKESLKKGNSKIDLQHVTAYTTGDVYYLEDDSFKRSKKVDSFFVAVEYQDGYVLLQLPEKYLENGASFLKDISLCVQLQNLTVNDERYTAYENAVKMLEKNWNMSEEEVVQRVPPLLMTVNTTNSMGFLGGMAYFVLIIVFVLFRFITSTVGLLNYKWSKIYRQIRAFEDPQEVELAMNQSVVQEAYLYRGNCYFIRSIYQWFFKNCILITREYMLLAEERFGFPVRVYSTHDLEGVYIKKANDKFAGLAARPRYMVCCDFKGVKKSGVIMFEEESEAYRVLEMLERTFSVPLGYLEA